MKLTDTQIAAYARAAGFPANAIAVAVAVALAESGGDPSATNSNGNGSTDSGLFQINSIHKGSFPVDYPLRFTPLNNARMAKRIWQDAGNGWKPWVAYTSGAYSKFLSRGNVAAGNSANIDTRTIGTLTGGGVEGSFEATDPNVLWTKYGVAEGKPVPSDWLNLDWWKSDPLPGLRPTSIINMGSRSMPGRINQYDASGKEIASVRIDPPKDVGADGWIFGPIINSDSTALERAGSEIAQVPSGLASLIPAGYLWIGGGAVLVTLGVLMIAK